MQCKVTSLSSSWEQVLAVQEKNGPLRGTGIWKLPTGLANHVSSASSACRTSMNSAVNELMCTICCQRVQIGYGSGNTFVPALVYKAHFAVC